MKKFLRFIETILFLFCVDICDAASSVYVTDTQEKVIVTGILRDKTEPLPLGNVTIKETSKTVTTDFDGNYYIEVIYGQTLIFSYPGYRSKEFKIDGSVKNPFIVILFEGRDRKNRNRNK